MLIENELISPQELYESYKELIAPLKSCLNDDWAPDLRIMSCKLVELLIKTLRSHLVYEDLRDIYAALLERLDDS